MKLSFINTISTMYEFIQNIIAWNMTSSHKRVVRNCSVGTFLVFFLLGMSSFSYAASVFVEDFQTYDGSGFSPSPSPPVQGQIDSNYWSATGMSDGAVNFGGTCSIGDCARGISSGFVTTGGLYAFDTGSGNTIFGWQATGSDFIPGTFDLRLQNLTRATMTELGIAYDIWSLNNAPRASSLDFSYSVDNSVYTLISSLNFNTPTTADAPAIWISESKGVSISNLNIPDGAYFYLRWSTNDVSGSGARDELGIDNISVSSVPLPPAIWLFGTGLLGLIGIARRKKAV